MPQMYSLELGKAGYIIAKDICKVKPGESVLLTVDSVSDFEPVEAVARAAEALGAKVMVAWHSTLQGYGKTADAMMPAPLKACVPVSDVWVEFNNQGLLYSTPWEEAVNNGRTRYLCLSGMDKAQIVRTLATLDMDLQTKFQSKVVELTKKAKHVRVTTPAGTDILFENAPDRPCLNELDASTPGAHFLLGQIGWAPLEHTINGKIVFDGTFTAGAEADLGILSSPIHLTVEKGVVTDITGGKEAQFVAKFLRDLNDPRVYNIAHFCYGVNPGAKLCGVCVEDERVWGVTVWGMGYQGSVFCGGHGDAVTHADGVCLNSTVYLDGEKLLDEGVVVHPQVAPIAREMGK